jgi:hypothetical protein
MAQEDSKGFAVDVGELDTIANSYLPQAADALRAPINVIMAREGINGPGTLPAVRAMEAGYSGFGYSADRFNCVVVVGTSPKDSFQVVVIAEDRNADSCPRAVVIAQRVIGNLGAEAKHLQTADGVRKSLAWLRTWVGLVLVGWWLPGWPGPRW